MGSEPSSSIAGIPKPKVRSSRTWGIPGLQRAALEKSHRAVVMLTWSKRIDRAARGGGAVAMLLIAGAVLAAWHFFVDAAGLVHRFRRIPHVARAVGRRSFFTNPRSDSLLYREIGYPLLLAFLDVQRHGPLPLWLAQWAAAAVTTARFFTSRRPLDPVCRAVRFALSGEFWTGP